MLLIPKLGKKPPKARKAIRRSRIKPGKVKFKAHGENPFKSYHCRRSPAETARWAEQEAERRRGNPTEAEAAVASILSRYGVRYEREKVWENGDHPITSDFWLPDYKLTIECDGENHRQNAAYDRSRAMWLARKHKVGTVRLWNRNVLSGAAEERIKSMLGLNETA